MVKKLLISLLLLAVVGSGCRPTPVPAPESQVDTPVPHQGQELSTEAPEASNISLEITPTNPASTGPDTPADELAVRLQGLDLEEFFEVSFRAILERSPESVLAAGLEDYYGVQEPHLDDLSPAYLEETYQMAAVILDILEGYDRGSLSPTDQVSYDVYQWHLQDRLMGWEYRLHRYPATFFPVTAVHEDLLLFLTDIHPIRDMEDGLDFVARLGQVSAKIDQLVESLELSQEAGITPPSFAIQWAVYGSLGQFVDTSPQSSQLYTAFKEKLDPMSSITPQGKQDLLDQAERIIQDEVIPAYESLRAYLDRMDTYPGEDSGVWRLPHGEAYYNYQLRHFTTTDMTAAEIHQLGRDELDRIHAEMKIVFSRLGYPADETIVQSYDRVALDGGHIEGDQVLATYVDLIAEAQNNLDVAFDIFPKAEVIVVPDPFGDFYVRGSVDGSRPGAFYAGVGESGKDLYAMPTLAYHETVPGHHFQIALAQEMRDLPSFRQGVSFTAYTEGWALYAEHLAWELGWYQDDPYGYLGLLQAQAFRAARLVVDTGLHAQGWTFSQAQDFFTENTGFEAGDSVNPQHQIARFLVWPAQSVSYFVGYQKILELRGRAMDELGDQFDLKEFHRVVLGNGSLPLELLEVVVENYIQGKHT